MKPATRLARGHIDPSLLFSVAEECVELDRNERDHLTKCEDCKEILAVFTAYLTDEAESRKH
jgi:hypothetical protein